MTKSSEELADIACKVINDHLIDLDPIDILDIALVLQFTAISAIRQKRSIASISNEGF